MVHASHCAEFIAYFRRTYRPDVGVREFERDLDRLVYEITALAYRDAQAPFIDELRKRGDLGLRAASLYPAPPKGPA